MKTIDMAGNRIVIDVETLRLAQELPGGWDATEAMGVGCACVYSMDQDRYAFYGWHNVKELRATIEEAGEIIGFNCRDFDLPVIYGCSRPYWKSNAGSVVALREKLLPKVNDIYRRVIAAVGGDPNDEKKRAKGTSLNCLAIGTLGRGKIGSGKEAADDCRRGIKLLDTATYCMDDVKITADLARVADAGGEFRSIHLKEPFKLPESQKFI